MPMGIQIVGRRYQEELILALMKQLDEVSEFHNTRKWKTKKINLCIPKYKRELPYKVKQTRTRCNSKQRLKNKINICLNGKKVSQNRATFQTTVWKLFDRLF